MKNYVVTPKLMEEYNAREIGPWGEVRDQYTGFVFTRGRQDFITCQCGYQGRHEGQNTPRNCPHCGGKLSELSCARSLDGRAFSHCVEIVKKGSVYHIYSHSKTLFLPASGEYALSDKKITYGTVDTKNNRIKLDKSVFGAYSPCRNSIVEVLLKRIPLYAAIRNVYRTGMYWAYNSEEKDIEDYCSFIENMGVSLDEIKEQESLYAIFLAHKLQHSTSEKSLNSFLKSSGLKKSGIAYIKSHNLFRSGGWMSEVTSFARGSSKEFEAMCKNLQDALDEKYPHTRYVLDLVDRGVMSLNELREIMEMFRDIEDKEFLQVNYCTVGTNKLAIEDFADFVKKNASRQQNVVSMYKERVNKLVTLGHPITLENLLDKGYFALSNSSEFAYSGGQDFDSDFEKDPLQCMRGMK